MTNSDAITVLIPAHPARARSGMLTRALNSVATQTLQPAVIHVEMDNERTGAAATRHRGLMAVRTPWVAFLDSDDMFKAMHLKRCLEHAKETGADMVYPWFEVVGGIDPFPPTHFSNDFDPANPIETTIVRLVRTGLAQEAGFVAMDRGEQNSGEDFSSLLKYIELGAFISHLKERTWYWTHGAHNTSGLPTKGDSR